MKAITPEECIKAQDALVPDFIINIFNDLIKIKWDGKSAKIFESDVEVLVNEQSNFDECECQGCLKVVPIFRNAGWEVNREYDIDLSEYYWLFSTKKC